MHQPRPLSFLFVGLLCGQVTAQAKPPTPKRELIPHFFMIANEKENSALSMECEGEPPFATIDCAFTQVTVHAPDAQQLATARAKYVKDIAADPRLKDGDRKEACEIASGSVADGPEARVAAGLHMVGRMQAICACKDDACAQAALVDLMMDSERTCKVYTHTFDLVLSRVRGERKWISTPAPSGLCSSVNATVIEGDETGLKWTFTQTRITADTSSELCKGLKVNDPAIYSWKTSGLAWLGCDLVDFGP